MGITALLLGACSNKDSAESNSSGEKEKFVATVNGEGILKTDYESQLAGAKSAYEQQGINIEDLDTEAKEEMERSVLDQLINTEVVLQAAQENNESIQQSEIDSELERIKSQFEDDNQFNEVLEANQLTEETLVNLVKDQLTVNKYIDSNIGEITASEDEVQDIYNQYKEQAEVQKQEPEEFDKIKADLEKEAIAKKKNEKTSNLIEDLRKQNEKNIEVLI